VHEAVTIFHRKLVELATAWGGAIAGNLDHLCERRRFKGLLESRLGFWLLDGRDLIPRACACI
jgi:hypothetical protein